MRRFLWIALASAALVGCGNGSDAPDAGPITVPDSGCPDGFRGSTAVCAPDAQSSRCLCATGTSLDTCLHDSDFAGTGFATPSACIAKGDEGCFDLAANRLIAPCCPGLRCVVSTACGPDSSYGGICTP